MSNTALVVDDSKSARFALRKFLEGFNYKVETADSAAEALKYLANNLPDVIFLDHIMPTVDGFEVLKQIKTDGRLQVIPVVICSSNDGEEYAKACEARGASSVLQKPPSTEQIAGVLAHLVNRTANYQATLPPLKPEDYALASTLAPLAGARSDASAAMDRLMATIPPKLIPTAHLPSKAPIVTDSPQSRPGAPQAPAAAPRPDLSATLPVPASDVDKFMGEAPTGAAETRLKQTVIEHLRQNLQAQDQPTSAMADPVHTPTSLPSMPSIAGFEAASDLTEEGVMRGDVEARIAKLTQNLFNDLAAMRAQITALQGQVVAEEKVRAIAIEAAKSRTNALAQSLEQHLTALRNNLEGVLRAQNDRMQQIAGSIRQIAAEEARRALAKSAQDISQRTAESLARTLAPQFGSGQQTKGW